MSLPTHLQEKDDLEARFNEVNQKVEQAASLQLAAQQELERARQQASEALRSMDVERQQLRTVNSKYVTLLTMHMPSSLPWGWWT